MQQLKIGLIGAGNIGTTHSRSIAELNNCILNAVCDIVPEKLKPFKDKCACFDNANDFFAKADVNTVLIAAPHYFHVPMALKAIEAGKHVIVEKPIAVQKSEAQKLVVASKAHPELKIAAMFNMRTLGIYRKIKSLIDNGELGKIMRVNWIVTTWFRTQYYYASGGWRASWRGEGGGALLNQCPHQLDLMQWLFGMPEKIMAHLDFGKYHDIEVEDDVTAFLRYPGGATGVFITSTGEAPGTNRLEITADRGRMVMENGKLEFIRNETGAEEFCKNSRSAFDIPQNWNISIPFEPANGHMHRDIIENHCNAILNGDKLIAEAAEGINGLELGNAMLLSGLTGKIVDLPINMEEFDMKLNELIRSSRYVKKTVTSCSSGFGNSFGK